MEKALNQYDIDIYGLKDKQYAYDFESGNEFFEALPQELVQKGHFKTHLLIDKSSTMLILTFHIKGNVVLTCDRSLDDFEEPVEITEKLILKYSDHSEVLDDDIELIKHDTPRINIAQSVYEFIALSLPFKKLHPRFRADENDEDTLVYKTEESNQKIDNIEQNIDPRWAALKNLK